MTAALLLCVAIVNDAIFADFHVAVYGPLPSVSSDDGYTPVKKSSGTSKTNTATARAAARSKASTLKHGAASSSSQPLVFDVIDGSKCTDSNPSGCRELVAALATKGNPACLRLRACRNYLEIAGETKECYKNKSCYRAVLAMDKYDLDASRCIADPAPCRKEWDKIMKALEAVTVTPPSSASSSAK